MKIEIKRIILITVMGFITTNKPDGKNPFEDIPWEMLQNIAIIQLYLEERWVEPFSVKPCPYSVLLHQTLSYLMRKECTAKELAKYVLNLPPFRTVTPEDYLILLKYMLKTELLEKTEKGTLIIGLAGGKLVDNYTFYGVFYDLKGYPVIYNQKTLGEVDFFPEVDSDIALAGKNWRVSEIDKERKQVYVVPSKKHTKNLWFPRFGVSVHDRIVQKIQTILLGTEEYAYLDETARDALAFARKTAENYDLQNLYTIESDKSFVLHPWCGSKKTRTLLFILHYLLKEKLEIQGLYCYGSPAIHVVSELPAEVFVQTLKNEIFGIRGENLLPFVPPDPNNRFDKYDYLLPDVLLRKAYVNNILDLEGIKEVFCGKHGCNENTKELFSQIL